MGMSAPKAFQQRRWFQPAWASYTLLDHCSRVYACSEPSCKQLTAVR